MKLNCCTILGLLQGLLAKHLSVFPCWPEVSWWKHPHQRFSREDDLVKVCSGTFSGIHVKGYGLWDDAGTWSGCRKSTPHWKHGLGLRVLEHHFARGLGWLFSFQLDNAGCFTLPVSPSAFLQSLHAFQFSSFAFLNESLHHRGGICDIGRPGVLFFQQFQGKPDVFCEFYQQQQQKKTLGNLIALTNNNSILQKTGGYRKYILNFPQSYNSCPTPLLGGIKSNPKLGNRMTFHKADQVKNSMVVESRELGSPRLGFRCLYNTNLFSSEFLLLDNKNGYHRLL